MNSYKDLLVFQRSYKLAVSIYRFTKGLPQDERYGMISQLKRAATSIPLNIAEGYGKDDSKRELMRFLKMSKGSCEELSVLLDLSKDLEYLEEKDHEKYLKEIDEIAKMLAGLVKSIKI